ncbi:MAG: SusC/RagA family TonB-linked outer membrane protein [Chitinophagaceae bacterium]
MNTIRQLRVLLFCPLFLLITQQSWAQNRSVTGTITDDKGNPVSGASVLVKGTKTGTSTDASGLFTVNVPASANTLTVTYVGYGSQDVDISGKTTVTISLVPQNQSLNEVVVIGYGTVRKKDLTGSVASVQAKDFNKGVYSSADQLIQGKAAGIQVINNSGQPGGGTTVKIRGNATLTGSGQPLYVVDGVPLDGRSPRPGIADIGLGGGNPASNPLNFINPSDIASIDILKDASATAIYGSRGAYGVVIITTKKGKTGQTRLDVNTSVGFAKMGHTIDVLNANQFRQALSYYGVDASNDKGANVNALDAITRTGLVQNYNVAISGGGENGKFRLALGTLNQEGIVNKSGIKKYSANFNANLTFLSSKRLGVDINIIPSQYIEDIAPITNNAGAQGSLIGQALQWNPTQPLKVGDSIVNVGGTSILNPLGISEAFNDQSKVTTILASVAPYFKFTDWLTYKFQYSINYATGIRRTSRNQNININPTNGFTGVGYAAIAQSELYNEQATHTLTFDKKVTPDLNLNVLLGYEYLKFVNKGSSMSSNGPAGGFGQYGLDYTNYIQYGDPSSRSISSYDDPTTELQSYFGRATVNYQDKYLVTATIRADGSTKFGKNNRYGYFPSFSVAWDIAKESFMANMHTINTLKLRGGWGKTGNQEFPSGSSQSVYSFSNNGGLGLSNNPNPDLKWQSDKQYNIGLDLGILKNRITATVDYFNKTTTDLLYPTFPIQPAPPGTVVTWKNLDGKIENRGIEATVNATIINSKNFSFDLGGNATFVKNTVSGLAASIPTGTLSGQGSSGATVEQIRNGYPMNSFFTRNFEGFDKATGQAIYTDAGNTFYYEGNPNPTTLLGITSTIAYKKVSLIINMNGAFGGKIYDETFNNVISVGDINGGRNIAVSVFQNPVKESLTNPVTSSSRFIESGNYLKMTNASLVYSIGNIAKVFQNASIYVTGQNLFTITNYKGFDPEINVDKNINGVPSVGIDYIAYPSARTITFGLNFSL